MDSLDLALEIKNDLFSANPNTVLIIKKCYSLCKQLSIDVDWIRLEHKGYINIDNNKIPKYRITNIQHGYDSLFQPALRTCYIKDPISNIQNLSKTGGSVYIKSPNPITFNIKVEVEISANVFRHILNSVNIRVQDFIKIILSKLMRNQ